MHIEKQVITREHAKKLHELGVKGETQLYWVDFTGFNECGHMLCRAASATELEAKEGFSWIVVGDTPENLLPALEEEACGASGGVYPAFSVAELGEMLVVGDDDHFVDGSYNEHGGTWDTHLMLRDEAADRGFRLINSEEGETEAQSRAEMLIHLIENNIVNAESVTVSLKE